MQNTITKEKIIIALDVSSKEEVFSIVETLGDDAVFYKIGLELFSAYGSEIVLRLNEKKKKIFFDGKFFDIPNTVSSALRNIVKLNVDILNIHILGGKKMMTEAKKAITEEAKKLNITPPKLIGVTILTSTSQDEVKTDMKVEQNINDLILNLAQDAKTCGLDGVVSSPNEAKMIREKLGKDFLIITPGIRPAWSATNDQKRIMTPKEAIQNGISHMVIGRPILKADNPKEALKKVLQEIEAV